MKRFIFTIVLALSACADRDAIVTRPDAALVATLHQTYVATARASRADGWFSNARSRDLSFLKADVSVPPNHTPGVLRMNPERPDPSRHFTFVGKTDFNRSQNFIRDIRTALRRIPNAERDLLVFVHGYNNSFADGVFRTVQMKHDFQLPGVSVHYSWASAANPLGYSYDHDSAMIARDGLESMLRDLVSAEPNRIVLVAHSLGSALLMESLRQIEIAEPGWTPKHIGGVVLISPDLDVDLFHMQAFRMEALPQPFFIFVSSKDRALRLSSRINGDDQRLGNLKSPEEVGDLPVTLLDVSEFGNSFGMGHFNVGNSPLLIDLLKNSQALGTVFENDSSGRPGLASGTAISVQNATMMILSPFTR